MTSAQDLYSLDYQNGIPSLPPCDLYSDEPPLETDLHLQQIILFLECLNWWRRDKTDFYAKRAAKLAAKLRELNIDPDDL